jgi:hypothetical protein
MMLSDKRTHLYEGPDLTPHASPDADPLANGPTLISGAVRWAGSDEGVSHAIVSIYTLSPAGLVGRAQADDTGRYQIESGLHWAGGHDLFVVVLDARGTLLQLTRNGPVWLTGPSTKLDIPVTVRRRPLPPTSPSNPTAPRRTSLPPTSGGTHGPVSVSRRIA